MKLKRGMVVLATGLACGTIQAQTFFDDFNRADTASSNNPAESIGAGWISGGEADALSRIYSNGLDIASGGTNPSIGNVLLHPELKTLNDGANSEFTLSAIVRLDTLANSGFAGLVLNYVGTNSCYLLRYNGTGALQLIRRRDGLPASTALNIGSAFTHVQNRPYKLTISSRTAYRYDITVRDTVTDTVVYSNTYAWEALELFEDGVGGVYASTGLASFDDVSLTYIVPSTTAVTDNFTRADTEASTASTSLGTNWVNGASAANEYRVFRKKLDIRSQTPPFMPLNTELETLNEGVGTNFTLHGTTLLNVASDSGFAGLTFNYQDVNNYYALRYGGAGLVQVVRVVNGSVSTLVSTSGAFSHTVSRPYELMVFSENPYNFEVSIRDMVDNVVVYSNTEVSDDSGNFSNGFGGFYANAGGVVMDDYYLDSTGALAPNSAYDLWKEDYGISGEAPTDDHDLDGLPNVYEYGLGGDPTNAADQGISPTYNFGKTGGTYVYPRAVDSRGVNYYLELTEYLVIPSWTNAGYSMGGIGVFNGEFDAVTNNIPTDPKSTFIRLIIEEQ